MPHPSLGIDVGSTNVKACALTAAGELRAATLPHEGNLARALERLLARPEIAPLLAGGRAVVTGTEGRLRVRLPEVIAPVAVERGLEALGLRPRAVVSMGGEDLVVYLLDGAGRIVSTYSGNKCASGTGEFFRQQLGRMDLTLEDLPRVVEGARVLSLSARCSVFMKSDCTHRLNKGEATKGDIALSLARVMADKVSEFLTRARLREGQAVLIGGVTLNRSWVSFLRDAWPQLELLVPEQAPVFEAFGAAQVAAESGAALPAAGELVDERERLTFEVLPGLGQERHLVHVVPPRHEPFDPDAEYVMGVDGGSTTTKIALLRRDTLAIVASHYGRTHGDPVAAARRCLEEISGQLGGASPRITMVATTGSSRELLGVFFETPAVFNEIIAHTYGTLAFEPDADTIFEIGGQDAKYVLINNGVPIDYAMNEACSAGTGSFLEESARGDLCIDDAAEIGPVALQATSLLKLGEHCSAFINSDIRKAIGQGAERPEIVAGLVHSIVTNYLNRVVGNRRVGSHVVLQGGLAKNPAVPLAFARVTGKPIVVPPDPELMGCFGVARLAVAKQSEGLLEPGSFELPAMLAREIVQEGTFVCGACENRCTIRRIGVGGHRYPFGGRCSLYTNLRHRRRAATAEAVDYTTERHRLLFEAHAPDPATLELRSPHLVGIPLALSVHSLYPLYAWFFHALGVRAVLSEGVAREGIARQESSYCFPVEIAHGAVYDLLERGVDFLFLPHFRDMPSMEPAVEHGCVCPLTQGLPFYARHAFTLDDERVLRPLVSFKHGWEASREAFAAVAVQLGLSKESGRAAFGVALEAYHGFLRAYRSLGERVLEEVRAHPERVYMALLGRPYNAFTADANMGIPRKLTSQGVTVVPFDMIYDPGAEILPNAYWYYGQENLKAVRRVRELPNLYLTWISNFSCAPDSFLLHYVRWMMGAKPYLVLEIDSHTADAGLDTRVEAFLDIVESYRANVRPAPERPFARRYSTALKEEFCDVVDSVTGERVDIRDPRVTVVWPAMGDLAVEMIAAATRRLGLHSVPLPLPDVRSTQLARAVASGKECIPALLVLGSILRFFHEHEPNRPGEIYVVLVPSTRGPCRTGQYHVFYDRLLDELGFENVVVLASEGETSYRELGPGFMRDVWRALVVQDVFTDVRTAIDLLAADPAAGQALFGQIWRRLLEAATVGARALDRELRRAARELAALPRRRTLDDVKKVMVVGEIYVRRDGFSVKELSEFLIGKGVFPKLAGITEWVHYTDYARRQELDGWRRRDGLLAFLRQGGLARRLWFEVERWWKHRVEERVLRLLVPTGLVPDAPRDLDRIIEENRHLFVEPDLESEVTVSPAVSAAAMQDGYSGIAIIAPFGCLIGRVVEGVFAPWAKAQGYPVIALENDGQPYPPSVVARMEVFAHHLARRGHGPATSRQ